MPKKQAIVSDHLPPGTVLEADEEILRIQEGHRSPQPALRDGNPEEKGSQRKEELFRPTSRPPVALLTIYDDGQTTGESVRLRHGRLVIGRTEGDLRFPDDEQISKRHIAITRQVVTGEYRWVITDLQSRNGLFVRINKAPLSNKSEVLIGSGRYRFEIVQQAVAETTGFGGLNAVQSPHTKMVQGDLAAGTEAFSELLNSGIGSRLILSRDEYHIGSDPNCEISRPNDPFTKSCHAKLARSPKGTWVIQNLQSLNGVWLRLPQITRKQGECCEFQIGEQRMRLRFGE